MSIPTNADFRQTHPDGQALSRDTRFSRQYGRNPYAGYDTADGNPFLFGAISMAGYFRLSASCFGSMSAPKVGCQRHSAAVCRQLDAMSSKSSAQLSNLPLPKPYRCVIMPSALIAILDECV